MKDTILSIVIGTYNRLDMLRQCLDSLIGQITVPYEIIVVDAGSTDGTKEYLRLLDEIILVCDDELMGQAKSLNRVFRLVKGEFTCWLSDDNIVQKEVLDESVNILQKNRDIGLVALKVKDVTGKHVRRPYIGSIWPSGILNCNQGVLPTKLLHQLGGFSEEFRDYGIDADLTTRVLLAGYKVVFTKQIAIHHYRNHEADSWIKRNDRVQRAQAAKDLYRVKYAALVRSNRAFSEDALLASNGSLRVLIWISRKAISNYKIILYHLVDFLNEGIVGYRVGAFLRDWYNVASGRFISCWDLFENRHQSYYLVQSMPDNLRSQYQIADRQH